MKISDREWICEPIRYFAGWRLQWIYTTPSKNYKLQAIIFEWEDLVLEFFPAMRTYKQHEKLDKEVERIWRYRCGISYPLSVSTWLDIFVKCVFRKASNPRRGWGSMVFIPKEVLPEVNLGARSIRLQIEQSGLEKRNSYGLRGRNIEVDSGLSQLEQM